MVFYSETFTCMPCVCTILRIAKANMVQHGEDFCNSGLISDPQDVLKCAIS